MKALEINRIAERGVEVSSLVEASFGKINAPEERSITDERLSRSEFRTRCINLGLLKRLTGFSALGIPLSGESFGALTKWDQVIGRRFGIMGRNQVVHSVTVAPTTRPGELHLTPLDGKGVRLAAFNGMDALDEMMFGISDMLRTPGVGTEAADVASGSASEIGHTMQVISALTDRELAAGMQNGAGHYVHGWAERGAIGVNLTQRSTRISAFSVKTDNGVLTNGFRPDLVFDGPTPGVVLIDHPSITDEHHVGAEVSPAQLAIGLGMLAAETQLNMSGRRLNDYLMQTAEAL